VGVGRHVRIEALFAAAAGELDQLARRGEGARVLLAGARQLEQVHRDLADDRRLGVLAVVRQRCRRRPGGRLLARVELDPGHATPGCDRCGRGVIVQLGVDVRERLLGHGAHASAPRRDQGERRVALVLDVDAGRGVPGVRVRSTEIGMARRRGHR